jgi:hypothetical protein
MRLVVSKVEEIGKFIKVTHLIGYISTNMVSTIKDITQTAQKRTCLTTLLLLCMCSLQQ